MLKFYSLLIVFFLAQSLIAKEDKYVLSQTTFDGITKVEKFIEDNKYSEAEKLLLELESSDAVDEKLDMAYIRFYKGYFYTLKNDASKAIIYFEKAVSSEALPPEQVKSAYLNLVQLYIDQDKYQKGISYLDKLIEQTTPVKFEYFVYKANAYLALKEYKEVIENLNKAITLSKQVKPEWLKTKFYSYYLLQDYPNAIVNLKKLIELEPKNKNHWLQLSSLYSMDNKFSEALSTLDISRMLQLDLNENELLQLISWLRYINIPYKAASIMQSKLEENIITANEKNMEYLGDLYYEAKELEKAIKWYSQAAEVSSKGKLYFKVSQIYSNLRNYEKVIKYIKLSLQTGDETNLEEKYLLLANADYELGHIKEAKQSLREAAKYPKTAKIALAWLNFLEE